MKHFLRSYQWESSLVVLIALAAVWGSTISPFFVSYMNLANSAVTFIPTALMVLGLFPVVVLGEMDISLASTLGLCAVVYARMWQQGAPVIVGACVSLLVALVCGLINGVFVSYCGLPSMAVTLGTMGIYRGIAYLVAGSGGIDGVSGDYIVLGSSWVGWIPVPIIVFAICVVLIWLLMSKTNLGQYHYAVGSQVQAVRFAGIQVKRVKVFAYVLAAVFSWLASILWVGQYMSARGDNADGTIMLVLTGVVLGGVSVFGGSGKTSGVTLSVILLMVVQTAMSLANVPGTTQTLVSGGILLFAVLLQNISQLGSGKRPNWLKMTKSQVQTSK